ncbi:MAG: hypothetical protein ACXVIP_02920 [Halobacteriota archaeon]
MAYKGGPLQKAALTDEEWVAAFDNLSMMMQNGRISYPNYPELIADLEVFKSNVTFTGAPDYTLQRGQDTAIRALCLVTYDVSSEDDWWRDVYCFYKRLYTALSKPSIRVLTS